MALSRRGSLLVLALVSGSLGAAWLLSQSSGEGPASLGGAHATEAALVAPRAREIAVPMSTVELPGEDTDTVQREEVPTRRGQVVLGVVRSPGGEPIKGATASWTAWEPDWAAYLHSGTQVPAEELLAAGRFAVTDPHGTFSFDLPDELPEFSALWVTAPGCLSWSQIWARSDAGEAAQLPDGRLEVELAPAPAVESVVRDAGSPVEAATIDQVFFDPRHYSFDEAGRPYAVSLLARRVETDSEGTAHLPPCDFQRVVVAHKGARISVPWWGPDQPEIALELGETFSLHGQVEISEWDPAWGAPSVEIVEQGETGSRFLGKLIVPKSGALGPVKIPLGKPGEEIVATLRGSNLVPEVASLGTPIAGEQVSVYMTARPGEQVWFSVLDPQDQPIEGAWVEVEWDVGPSRHKARAEDFQEGGYFFVRAAPMGVLKARAGAPGFATARFTPLMLPQINPMTQTVRLVKAVPLVGVVLDEAGESLADFDIAYWSPEGVELRNRVAFAGSQDGRFEVAGAPGGALALFAEDADHRRSEVLWLSDTGPRDELELVVGHGRQVRGRVVIAAGLAVGGASVGLGAGVRYLQLDPRGLSPVDSDGGFDLAGVPADGGILVVRAPGFSELRVAIPAGDEAALDLGWLVLAEATTLIVELGDSGGRPPEDFMVQGNSDPGFPTVNFNADRLAVVPGLRRGRVVFRISDGASSARFEFYHVDLDAPVTRVVVDVPAGRSVAVRAHAGSMARDLNGVVCRLSSHSSSASSQVHKATLDREGKAEFRGVEAGPYLVTLMYPAGELLGVASGVFEGDDSVWTVDISADAEPIPLQVVTASGSPVEGAHLSWRPKLHALNYEVSRVSDAGGLLMLDGLGKDVPLELRIRGPKGGLGQYPDFDLDPPTAGRVQEIVFEPSGLVESTLKSAAAVVAGVEVSLLQADPRYLLSGVMRSDASGRVALPPLVPGDYRMRLRGGGIWPEVRTLAVSSGSEQLDVQVYLTCTGSGLRLLTAEGLPISGAEVTVEHLATEGGVGRASGLFAGTLEAGGEGWLEFPALPSGSYRWSFGKVEGSMVLESGARITRVIE